MEILPHADQRPPGQRLGVEMAERIPYDTALLAAQLPRTSVVEYGRGKARPAIQDIWRRIPERIESSDVPDDRECVVG